MVQARGEREALKRTWGYGYRSHRKNDLASQNCHRGLPEANTKLHNTALLRKYKAKIITVQREGPEGKGGTKVVNHRFEVPQIGSFSNSNSRCGLGVTMAEAALATRAFVQLKHPTKLMEEVELTMHARGWTLIWTPLYMPPFQPIELFWLSAD